jgi:ElaB/YqjD/DUF883 family membrane-anchored ribosome-binding protein
MNSQNGHVPQALYERIDSIAAGLKDVADQLSSTVASVKGQASDLTSHAVSRASWLRARASKAIQDHPIAAIGIAFGAGYLIMRVMRR